MGNGVQAGHWSWGAKLLLVLVLLTSGVLTWQAIQPWLQRHEVLRAKGRVEILLERK